MVEWLKHHVEPHSKVKQYIAKTSINRAAWIKENPQLSICDIMKEHPRLFDIPGMVSIDVHRVVCTGMTNLTMTDIYKLHKKWIPSFVLNIY